MKKKIAALLLIVIGVPVLIAAALVYEQENAAPYTVIGTLTFAPWHAVTPGVTVVSVSPSLSPSPGPLTWQEPNGQNGYSNYTVDAFVIVNFKGNFAFTPGVIGFPTGFMAGDTVKLSGDISYDENSQLYSINVTSISHYAP
jgi:hypothetical protein